MSDETFRWVVAGGVAIATLSMFTMAVVTVVLLRVVGRLHERVNSIADRTEPVIDSVRYLINENAAKVNAMMTAAKETAVHAREIAVQGREVAIHASEVAVVARDQAREFAELGKDFIEVGRDMALVGRDVADRARERVAQVDSAVDDTVVQIQNLGDNVRSGVMRPIHEVSGVLAGIKAGVAAFANGQRPSVARATQDEEMFI